MPKGGQETCEGDSGGDGSKMAGALAADSGLVGGAPAAGEVGQATQKSRPASVPGRGASLLHRRGLVGGRGQPAATSGDWPRPSGPGLLSGLGRCGRAGAGGSSLSGPRSQQEGAAGGWEGACEAGEEGSKQQERPGDSD